MAYYYPEAAHTFSEYLLVPGYSSSECIPEKVSLRTPLAKFRRGEEPRISLNIPHGLRHHAGGLRGRTWPSPWRRRAAFPSSTAPSPSRTRPRWSRAVKSYKAGFVMSDSNLRPR